MIKDNYEKLLETFRRNYFDTDYSKEKCDRILEKKAMLLNIDYNEGKKLVDDLLRKYEQFKEICEEFVVDGKITKSGLLEIEELKGDLGFSDEEKNNLINCIIESISKDENESSSIVMANKEVKDDDIEENDNISSDLTLAICGNHQEFLFSTQSLNDWLHDRYMQLHDDLSKEFMQKYRNFGSLENMLNNIDNLFEEYMYKFSERIVNELSSDDILEYTSDDICENAYSNYGGTFEAAKEKVINFLEQLEGSTEAIDAYRTARRKSRGKYIGFGSEGIAKAGMANMATGAVHGMFNIIGKGVTSIGNSLSKNNMYKDVERDFEQAYFYICVGLYNSMSSIYIDNDISVGSYEEVNERKKKSVAIIENCIKSSDNVDRFIDAIKNSLYIYHYNNFKALDLLFDLSISVEKNVLKDNMSNLKILRDVIEKSFNIYPDTHIVNKKYSELLKEIKKTDIDMDGKKRLLSLLDDYMIWNKNNHADLKQEFVFENRDTNFIELDESINKPIGNAFKKIALDAYNTLGASPFGEHFFSCLDNKFETRVNNAYKLFVNIIESVEQPIFIYDDTLTGSTKSGILITDKRIYMRGLTPIRVDEVQSVNYSVSFGVTYLEFNGLAQTSLTYIPNNNIEKFKKFISDIFDITTKNLAIEKGTDTYQLVDEVAVTVATDSIDYNTLSKELVSSINGSDIKLQIFYCNESDKANTKFNNAISSYAKISGNEIPLICFDNTVMGGAKDGFVITNEKLYAHNMWADPWSIEVKNIKEISYKGSDLCVDGKKVAINLIKSKDRDSFCNFVQNVIATITKK